MTQKTCFCHLMLKQTTPRNMQYDSRHICDFIHARQKVKFRLCKSLTSSYKSKAIFLSPKETNFPVGLLDLSVLLKMSLMMVTICTV